MTNKQVAAPGPAMAPNAGGHAPPFGIRLTMGLLGALLAAIVAGLNNRVPGLALADLQGELGFARRTGAVSLGSRASAGLGRRPLRRPASPWLAHSAAWGRTLPAPS